MRKEVTLGTHRAVPPERTWERIRPFFPEMGITRVADITGLDTIGIPVFQAIRPNARTQAISQGKGITPELAKVSAAMESIELWHAEEMDLTTVNAAVQELAPSLPYSVFDLPRPVRSALCATSKLSWVRATDLAKSSHSVWVPEEFVRLGVPPRPIGLGPLPTLRRSSDGLASGNEPLEALLHALYEVIERDAVYRVWKYRGREFDVALQSVEGAPRQLIDQFRAADISIQVRDLTSIARVPCYETYIWSRDYPYTFGGWGCHYDHDVALCRALTEAAQSRLGYIAGARDDLRAEVYELVTQRTKLTCPFPSDAGLRRYQGSAPGAVSSFADDLEAIIDIIGKKYPNSYWVDLTKPDFKIPVVRVIVPGMKEGPI
ncbi:YcaO-like family protein [Streptomyces sp. NPDC001139]